MERNTIIAVCLSAVATALTSCGKQTEPTNTAPADIFLHNIAEYCGKAFSGRVVANEPSPTQSDPFADKELIMHVRGCDIPTSQLRIPFHVGDDRSRTWILTRTDSGLQLKHDHRHEDGSEDKVTMYGGTTTDAGTATRQEFPVDEESIAMFKREGLNASIENTWAMEIHPGEFFAYELTRPNGRKFRVEFDLRKAIDVPPPPWGQ